MTGAFSELPGGALAALVHTGWERLGDQAQAQRDNWDIGWDYVLGKYISTAERE